MKKQKEIEKQLTLLKDKLATTERYDINNKPIPVFISDKIIIAAQMRTLMWVLNKNKRTI